MGKGKSTIKIKIGSTEEKITRDHFEITSKTGDYDGDKKFKQYTYTIQYKSDDPNYNLTIEAENGKDLFTYYKPSENKSVSEIYVFFHPSHKSRPLIIGFKAKDGSYYYYRYRDLEYVQSTTKIKVPDIIYISIHELKAQLNEQTEIIKEEIKPPGTYNKGKGCIYFSNKGEVDKGKEYGVNVGTNVTCSIRVTNKNYQGYKNIRQVTYTIVYAGDPMYGIWDNTWYRYSNYYYYLYFFKGTIDVPGREMFSYHPRNNKFTVKEIDAYCSLIYINQPFFIIFKTEDEGNLSSSFDTLDALRTGYNYDLDRISETEICTSIEKGYYKKFKKIMLKAGEGPNENIKTSDYVFNRIDKPNPAKKYKKVIFISGGESKESTVHTGCLFTLNKSDSLSSCDGKKSVQSPQEGKITNKPIDEKHFKSLTGTKHEGVVICYTDTDDIAIFVEIHTDWNTNHQFARNDLDGDNWKSVNHEYDSDSTFAKILESIETDMASRMTYRLEKNSDYNGNYVKVSTNSHETHGYTVCTHLAKQSTLLNSTKLVYNDKTFKLFQNTKITKKEDRLDGLDRPFKEINLYYINTSKDHLMMNLKENNKSHYLHRFNKEGTEWKQISLSDVIELGMISSQVLKFKREQIEKEELGKRLDGVLSNNDNCKKMLHHISHSFSSIIVLMDYKKQYGLTEMNDLTGNGKEISPAYVANTVEVEEYKGLETCQKLNQYQIFKHNLTTASGRALEKVDNNLLYIRLYSESKRIILTEDNASFPATCLTYDKKCNEIFVYFNNDGTKPLLVFYNKTAYGPKENNNTWVKINEINDCKTTANIEKHLTRISKLVKDSKPIPGAQDVVGKGNIQTGQGTGKTGRTDSQETQAGPSRIETKKQGAGDHGKTLGSSSGSNSVTQGKGGGSASKQQGDSPTSGTKEHTKEPRVAANSNDNQRGLTTSESNTQAQGSQLSSTPDSSSTDTIVYAAAGGGAGAIGTGVGGYFLYTKCIKPRRL